MTSPTPRPGIMDIAPYVGGSHAVTGIDRVIVLSANENPLGPSPKAKEAYDAMADELHRYPDGGAVALRQAIGKRFRLDPDRIVCGAGSDELISLLIGAYAGPGDEVLYSQYGFLMYAISAKAAGATPVTAPEKNLTADVDSLLEHVTENTRMLFLANPNNPTGTCLPASELRRLRENLRADVLLVIDAAYAEYVKRNDYEAGLELVATTGNTVMTRTFSKVYGLAALRIGWCYAPAAIAGVLNRIRGPFNVSAPAIAAAVAAIKDGAHMDQAVAHNDRWLTWVTGELEALGLEVTPSVANFVLIHFPGSQGKSAADADAALSAKGILLRRVEGYGFPNALRMTIGTEDENRQAIAALKDFMGTQSDAS